MFSMPWGQEHHFAFCDIAKCQHVVFVCVYSACVWYMRHTNLFLFQFFFICKLVKIATAVTTTTTTSTTTCTSAQQQRHVYMCKRSRVYLYDFRHHIQIHINMPHQNENFLHNLCDKLISFIYNNILCVHTCNGICILNQNIKFLTFLCACDCQWLCVCFCVFARAPANKSFEFLFRYAAQYIQWFIHLSSTVALLFNISCWCCRCLLSYRQNPTHVQLICIMCDVDGVLNHSYCRVGDACCN